MAEPEGDRVVPNGVSQFSFFNSEVTFSNSTPATSVVTLDGSNWLAAVPD